MDKSKEDLGKEGLAVGLAGGQLINDTESHKPAKNTNGGSFKTIVALEDATFTTLTSDLTTDGETLAVAADWGTLEAGAPALVANFTEIKLATGKVVAYY